MTEADPGCGVDDVIITDELARRPSRAPDYEGENNALGALAEAMANTPGAVLQKLVEEAMTLTRADSAGISLLEPGGAEGIFRWVAMTGKWAPYKDGRIPREASPCGEVVAREKLLLVRHPERAFPALLQGEPGIKEGLLTPFDVDGAPGGTLWVVKHDPDGRFDAEDARLLQSLARFAAAGRQMAIALDEARAAHAESESRAGKSEEQRALAIDVGGIGHWDFDLATGELTSSAHCRRNFGRSEGDPFSYEELVASIHPDDRERQRTAVSEAIEAKSGFDIEYRIVTPQGETRWIHVQGRYEDGDRPRLVGVSLDITERKRADAVLRESEERLTFLLKFSDALRPLTEAGDIEKQATRLLGEHLEADRCFLSPVYDDGSGMCVREEYLRAGASSVLGDYTFAQFGDFVGPELHAGRILAVEDVAALTGLSAAERASYAATEIGAYLLIPLVRNGQLAAFLTINHRTPRQWSDADKAVARQTADRLWAARERSRAETALRESEEERRSLIAEMNEGFCILEVILDEAGNGVDYRFLETNPAFVRQGGFDPAGRLMSEIAPIEPIWPAAYGRVATTGAPERIVEAAASFGRIYDVYAFRIGRAPDRRIAVFFTDITALMGAEEALRESEERLALVFDALPVGIAIIDTSGATIRMNDEMRRFLPTGIIPSRDEAHGTRWKASSDGGSPVQPNDYPGARALRGEDVVPGIEMLYMQEEAREIWTRVAAVPIRSGNGSVTGAIVIVIDIDSIKRSEGHLRESEERLRLIVENARDYAIFTTDADGIIDDWLPGAEAVFGWSRDEAIGRPADIVFTPEDQAEGEPDKEIEIARERGTAPDVRWHQREDGSLVFISGTVTPLRDQAGGIRGYLKIGQDVTERRAAEEGLAASERRMRSLATGIPQLVFRSHGTGERTWGSPQWIEFTGLSFEESLGFGWLEAVHPDDREATRDAWEDVEERGEYYCEHRIYAAASGTFRWHQTRATPLRDEKGHTLEWLGSSSDVEELRQLQQHQKTLLAELQHRVRNTLAIVRSIARRTAQTSNSVEDMASHFTGRLDAFSRVQAAVTRNPQGGVDLAGMIEDELLAHAAREDENHIIRGPDVCLKPRAAESVSLAIHELTSNAVKYGALSADGGRLSVRWERERPDGSERLRLVWEESGLDGLGEPARQGFGMELLQSTLPYDLRAETNVEFRPEGLRFTMTMPLGPNSVAE